MSDDTEVTVEHLKELHGILLRNNIGKEKRLAGYGGGLRPEFVLEKRINALCDALLPRESTQRLEMEIRIQNVISEALDMGLNEAVLRADQAAAVEKAAGQRPGLHVPPAQKGLVLPGKG